MALLQQAVNAYANYGNVGRLFVQRLFPKQFRHFEVSDRRSGITCTSRPGAHRLFAEIWFEHDYDVPGVPLRSGDVVLDIGANQGFYSCYAAHQGARVHSFEPDVDNLALLRKNVARNGFDDRVTILPSAMKGYSGTTSFYTTSEMDGSMDTTIPAFARAYGHQQVSDVPCVSLGDHVAAAKIDSIRMCKIDCEGAELEIIESLTPELAARIDGLAIEFHPAAYNPVDLVIALEKLGTHNLLMAPPKSYCARNLIWGISRTCVRDQAAAWKW